MFHSAGFPCTDPEVISLPCTEARSFHQENQCGSTEKEERYAFCFNQMGLSKAEANEDPLNNSPYSSDKQNVSNWNFQSRT